MHIVCVVVSAVVVCVLPCRCQYGALITLFRFWVAVTQDKGPPTSPTGAWKFAVHASITQRGPPPCCFGSDPTIKNLVTLSL